MPLPYPYQGIKDPLAIPVGFLRHEVRLAKPLLQDRDASGEPGSAWTVYLTALAGIEQLSGKDLLQGDQWASQTQWRVTLRWPGCDVVAGQRVYVGPFTGKYPAHTFEVLFTENVQLRNRKLLLTCLEVDGGSG
jgi:head-tail adaptor